jgi:predicted nucleotidyltransferase
MKTFEEIKKVLQKHREEFREQYGLKEIGIFGSYVKGEQKEKSDIDMLIELEKPIGFVRFMRLENALSRLLGVRVEMVTKKALKPYIGKRILQEVKYV